VVKTLEMLAELRGVPNETLGDRLVRNFDQLFFKEKRQ
jgi:Tat protein secretion system quality control protein TatD with DNase activity